MNGQVRPPSHKFDELFIKAGYVVALRFSFRTRYG
ncbi:hypothetical protein SPAB_01633 [Salmonella enterica subsp. enterica serovar Paratyphi B str. SPB7]|uniref:Uncharacterized protein n=1 Tax=Salmonella paratyphi B (strain ATCC BAA-1250 / SPB7) TaxID=1016998 RepID=A0A6C6Z0F4_SALPB|nr:hypothetical protein SPAB_01633 [Salmonella enterica subsp. enterica serovar Paratyphi B str. SPB7]